MSALATLETGLLLGLYTLLAGAWGVLYTLARLQAASMLGRCAAAGYGLHAVAALTIIWWTPLSVGWKCLIAASSLVFLAVPPATWRFLERTHREEGSEHDRQPSQHSARVVARL